MNTYDVTDIDPVVVEDKYLNDSFKRDHSFNILSPIDQDRGFKLAHLNARILLQKLDQLRISIVVSRNNIRTLNETVLNE